MGLGRSFRKLWSGSASANLADGIAFISIPLIATSVTSDAVLIAGLAAVYSAVRLFVVLPVGVYVDRIERRTVLWVANLVRAALLVGVGALFSTGAESIAVLYVLYAVLGTFETAADNASVSLVPSLVPVTQLDRGNGRLSAAQLVVDEFVGPPLGGFLFAATVALPLYVMGGMYAIAAAFFLALPLTPRLAPADKSPKERGSVFREAAQGANWLRRHPLLRGLAVIGGLASVAYMMPFSILVLYAGQTLNLSAAGYGVVLSISAIGGLAGSLITAPLRTRVGYSQTIAGSLALGCATLVGLAFTSTAWVAAVLLAAYILHAVVWGICTTSIRQRLVPENLRGRVNAAFKVLGLTGLTLGALMGGVLAETLTLAAPFLAGGIIFGCCAAGALLLFQQSPVDG